MFCVQLYKIYVNPIIYTSLVVVVMQGRGQGQC